MIYIYMIDSLNGTPIQNILEIIYIYIYVIYVRYIYIYTLYYVEMRPCDFKAFSRFSGPHDLHWEQLQEGLPSLGHPEYPNAPNDRGHPVQLLLTHWQPRQLLKLQLLRLPHIRVVQVLNSARGYRKFTNSRTPNWQPPFQLRPVLQQACRN